MTKLGMSTNPFAQLMRSQDEDEIADLNDVDAKIEKEKTIADSFAASKFRGRPPKDSFVKEGKLLKQRRPPRNPASPAIFAHLHNSPAYQEYKDDTRTVSLGEARKVANNATDMKEQRSIAGKASVESRQNAIKVDLTPIVDAYKLEFKVDGIPTAQAVAKRDIEKNFPNCGPSEQNKKIRNLAARLRRAKLAT